MVVVGTTTVAQRNLANVEPTYFCQPYANDVGHVGKNKKWKYLFFDFLICFPGVKYKISHKNGFKL